MKVTPFETYQTYLSMKSHFTNRKYDFFKYGGKSRATMSSFNKRKDKYWFEKTSRKYSDEEVLNFLLANFVNANNPQNLWIGEIINSGERTYAEWMKRKQSMTYIFKEQSENLLSEIDLEELFNCSKGHPLVLKRYLGVKPDIIGVNQHWYSINGHEVPVDAITELDNVEELDESDTV